MKALFTWLSLGFNKELASLGTTSIRADPANIVATGSSAGGFVAYLAGLYGSPKPKAICSLYGPPCALSDHWVIPKEKPFFGTPPKQFPLYTSNEKFLPFLTASPNAPPTLETSLDPAKDARVEYIAWLMQSATFYDKLFGE